MRGSSRWGRIWSGQEHRGAGRWHGGGAVKRQRSRDSWAGEVSPRLVLKCLKANVDDAVRGQAVPTAAQWRTLRSLAEGTYRHDDGRPWAVDGVTRLRACELMLALVAAGMQALDLPPKGKGGWTNQRSIRKAMGIAIGRVRGSATARAEVAAGSDGFGPRDPATLRADS
jgi:hypothetical protein